MTSIIEIMHKRLMDTIKNNEPPGKWKLVIVDSRSQRILDSACKMFDILGQNVTLVENIEKKRDPCPSLAAVYFLTPCRESVLRLIDDFVKTPMYARAYVNFTSALDDDLFDELNHRLKHAGVSKLISGLKELYVDFQVVESSVFTAGPATSLHSIYGTDSREHPEEDLRETAKHLLSVCATLGEDPVIRYYQPPPGQSTCHGRALAESLHYELENFRSIKPNFPPIKNPPQPRATLLILDRSVDVSAPILHEFTYQAMLCDLLDVKPSPDGTGLVYTYDFNTSDGGFEQKEVVLDENDTIYNSIRHKHIADCTNQLVEDFNQFLEQNKSAVNPGERKTDTARSLKEMKEMLTNLPQFQEMKTKFSTHISMAQECMSYFERQKLSSLGLLEQNMVMGETPEGEIPKTIVLDMVPLLDDRRVSPVDKARLLMLYIISKEGGIFEDDKRKLMEHAKLPEDLRVAIDNLTLLGVKVTRERRGNGEKSQHKRTRTKRASYPDGEQPYDTSRYVPAAKRIMEAWVNNQLDADQFPTIREAERAGSGSTTGQGATSLRTNKAAWADTRATTTGAKLIVFIIGGASYSEIRSAYEVASTYNRDVIIGTNHILKPTTFVDDLAYLRRAVPPPLPDIPPYRPPSPTHSSRPTVKSQSSQLSLSNLSIDSNTTTGTDKQKKKRGLRKLFS